MQTPTGRIGALDTVRGVAVLGILLLNIISFAMPQAAYSNPAGYGGAQGADLAAYLINFVLFDGKMRGLFSFLFGASLLLVVDRAEAKGESPALVHYSRMVWLLVFGLLHMWLVWKGDILVHYALVGCVAFFLRHRPPIRLVAIGVILLIVETLLMGEVPDSIRHAQADLLSHDPHLVTQAQAMLADYRNQFGVPDAAFLARDLAEHRGAYWPMLLARVHETIGYPGIYLVTVGWETLAYMCFGMAALRSGMLTGAWPRATYVRIAWAGLGIGGAAYGAMAGYQLWTRFDLHAVALTSFMLSVPARAVMIPGWVALILLLMRPGGALTARLAAGGRMAFTNYLATSLICATLFYGYGLGWYGQVPRAPLYAIVAAIWAAILLWSPWWLGRFAYGPLEWLWRSLARAKVQPLRRT